MAGQNLLDLPDEVMQTILSHLPPTTTVSLGKTARRFRNVSTEPLIWRYYCQTSFRHWGAQHSFRAKVQDGGYMDWKSLFATRTSTNTHSRTLFDDIVRNSVGRIDKIDRLIDGGNYDVKDELLDAFERAPESPYHLAQRYWAHVALGRLHRLIAVQEWQKLKFREDAAESFETALGAFDMFILHQRRKGDIQDILDRLDAYAAEIRNHNADIDELTPAKKAVRIAECLLRKEWVGISQDRHYHSLDHMFLGVALHSPLRNSLPLITAVIYSAVCRRLGLRATPCSFPFHVHVVVSPPPGVDLDGNPFPSEQDSLLNPRTTLFMDPFNSATPVLLSALQIQLDFLSRRRGVPLSDAQRSSLLSPSTPRDITIRSATNIINSSNYNAPAPAFPIPEISAVYSALFSLVMLPTHDLELRQNLAQLLQLHLEHFPHDLPMIESHILPLSAGTPDHLQYRRLMSSLRTADTESKPAKLHSDPKNTAVKYKVGQVFRHRIRGYLAVITGWDNKCDMAEEWIVMNQVGRLERGKHQPFYNVLVEDTSSRYVAEDNVVLLSAQQILDLETSAHSPNGSIGREIRLARTSRGGVWQSSEHGGIVDKFPIELGRYFRRFDYQRGVFVSNLTDEYPED